MLMTTGGLMNMTQNNDLFDALLEAREALDRADVPESGRIVKTSYKAYTRTCIAYSKNPLPIEVVREVIALPIDEHNLL